MTPLVITFYTFNYDVNGNLTQRKGHWWSPHATNIGYDEMDRTKMVEQTGWNEGVYARDWQQYDSSSRLTAQWRQLEGDRGERYEYDAMRQLTRVDYNAR